MDLKRLQTLIEDDLTLAGHWARVFEHPGEPDLTGVAEDHQAAFLAAHATKVRRVGRLHPDAAFDIAKYLRSPEGGGYAVTEKDVATAKELTRGLR